MESRLKVEFGDHLGLCRVPLHVEKVCVLVRNGLLLRLGLSMDQRVALDVFKRSELAWSSPDLRDSLHDRLTT